LTPPLVVYSQHQIISLIPAYAYVSASGCYPYTVSNRQPKYPTY